MISTRNILEKMNDYYRHLCADREAGLDIFEIPDPDFLPGKPWPNSKRFRPRTRFQPGPHKTEQSNG